MISNQASPHPIPWFAEIAVFMEIIRSKYQLMNYKNKLTKYYRWTLTIFQELVSLVPGPSGPVGYPSAQIKPCFRFAYVRQLVRETGRLC